MSSAEKAHRRETASAAPGAERQALLDALFALLAPRGYAAAGVDSVCARAGLERAVSESHFESLDACIDAAWLDVTQRFGEMVGPAFGAAAGWREGLRAAAWAYCRFLQDNPVKARFSI